MSGNTASTSTHVYILGFSDGVVKIGRTGNPDRRFSALKLEAEKRGARLSGTWLRRTSTPARSEDALRAIGRLKYDFEQGREYFRAEFSDFIETVKKYAYAWDRVIDDETFDAGTIQCPGGLTIKEFAWTVSMSPKLIRGFVLSGEIISDLPNGMSRVEADRWLQSLPTTPPGKVA